MTVWMPKVACLCPTFNRYPKYAHLLEEAVWSFVRQDYPVERRHLVVLNDTPGYTLALSREFMKRHRDNVVILNTDTRYQSLGAKRNALAEMADKALKPDIILPWDDDDISLPGRISQAVSVLRDYVRFDKPGYWNPRWYWYLPGNELEVPKYLGWGHNTSAMTMSAFRAVNGYKDISLGEDADIDTRLRQAEGVTIIDGLHMLEQIPSSWPYIYRWQVGPHHLSSSGDCGDTFYDEIGKMTVEPELATSGQSIYDVYPRWGRDYPTFVADKINTMPRRTYL